MHFLLFFSTPLLIIFLLVVTLPGHLHYWCKLPRREEKLKKKYRKQLLGVCNTAKFCIDQISSNYRVNITNTFYFISSLCALVPERANIFVYQSEITPRRHSACLSSMSGDLISLCSTCLSLTAVTAQQQSKAKQSVQCEM